MVFRVMICAVTLVLLKQRPGRVRRDRIWSVRVGAGDDVQCVAPNVGTSTIASVEIDITFNRSNGAVSSGAGTTCNELAPDRACH